MKTNTFQPCILALSIFVCAEALAQYSVNWHSVSGGGGTSAGGGYSVTGTIGQADAGTNDMSGGSYAVTGGFWSLLATVETPEAPTLKIFLTSTNTAIVYWPIPSTGFNLQQNASLSATNWALVNSPVQTVNGMNQVTISPLVGTQFYRLSK